MKRKRMVLLTMWACYACYNADAQSVLSVSGRVMQGGTPVTAETVVLHQLPDSATVSTAVTDSVGSFIFSALPEGLYYVQASSTGQFSAYSSKLLLDEQHPTAEAIINITATGKQLEEVAITGKKALVVHLQDRTIVNIDAMLSAAGATALEVLAKAPGVQVDQNDNISLKGKQGVTIYIDDKPTYMTGDQLAAYLKGLPASAIDQLELMTNPPAQYDAAGNAGIINIKTKKKGANGTNATINLSLNQGQLTRSANSININHRSGKVNAYVNMGYYLGNGFADLKLNRIYLNSDGTPASYFEQGTYFRRNGNNYSATAGVDYDASPKTNYGLVLTGMYRTSTQLNDNTSNLLNAGRAVDSVIAAHNDERGSFKNSGVNLNFNHWFSSKEQNITVNADYLNYDHLSRQVYNNTGYSTDGALKSHDVLTGHLPGSINILSGKADFNTPLNAYSKLSAGVKQSLVSTGNTADYSTTINNVTQPDYSKSNQFTYRENISAGYLSLSAEKGLFSLQAGLRAEHTYSAGHQLGNPQKPDSAFNRSYTNLFPTVYASWKMDSAGNQVLGINYGRRIDRPYYEDMNPFLSPIDKFTYYVGNPFLRPSLTHTVELSYSWKSIIIVTLNYSRATNEVNETIEIRDGIYYSRPGNIGQKTVKTLSVNASPQLTKWLKLDVYTELGHIAASSDFYSGRLQTSSTYGSINGAARFGSWKDWDIELSGNYRSRIYDVQFIIQDIWMANLAVQKKLTKAITLRASFNDIFYSRVINGAITNLSNATAGWTNRNDSRNVALSVSWRLGTTMAQRQKADAAAGEEKNRVKN